MEALSLFRAAPLIQAQRRLCRSALTAAAASGLRADAAAVLAELHDAVVAEVPAYLASQDALALGELARHLPQQLQALLRLLDGGALDGFGFVQAHAALRAEHRFPLDAVLHTYRCAHRAWVHALAGAAATASTAPTAPTPLGAGHGDGEGASGGQRAEFLAALADFALEYSDAVSVVATAAYAERSQRLADLAEDRRAELLTLLLDGYDESDARVAAVLRREGFLDGRRHFCVVLAQSVDAAEMASPARARRLADAIHSLVPQDLARRLIEVRAGKVVAVFSALRRSSGWTAPQPSLATQLAAELATAGNSVLIGLSADVASTSRIPVAHRQALLAMRMAGMDHRVVEFAATPLRKLMIHLAGEELQRLLPAWAQALYAADHKLSGTLLATLRAYADADMNLLKAALRLDVHPNTVYARMGRVQQLTGLNPRAYQDLTDLLTVADAHVAGAAAPPV